MTMEGNYLILYSAKVNGEWWPNMQYYGHGTRDEVTAMFNVEARNGDLNCGKAEVRIDRVLFLE